jgi:hypothetical protein
MSRRTEQKLKERAKKRAAKKAAFDRPEGERQTSRCAKRKRERANGVPMASRAHETPPYWDGGVRGSLAAKMARSKA